MAPLTFVSLDLFSAAHYADAQTVCPGGSGSCERVQGSEYADLAGVAAALVGLLGYASPLVAFPFKGDRARMAAAFLGLGGLGFSIYLTYIELFVIDAICQWCVASALVTTELAAIALGRYVRGDAWGRADCPRSMICTARNSEGSSATAS